MKACAIQTHKNTYCKNIFGLQEESAIPFPSLTSAKWNLDEKFSI